MRSVSLLLLLCSVVSAANYTCATCHVNQARNQPSTPMGRALLLPAANDVLKPYPKLQLQRDGYTYTVTTSADNITYSVSDGVSTISAPVRYGFGARTQTWVLERNGKQYESLVSYYPAVHGLDVTIGDNVIHPKTLEEAFGRPLSDTELTSCFGCHSSNSIVDHKLELEHVEGGLTCSHCHVNADAHLASVSHGKLGVVPPKLKHLGAEDMSTFCGQCHRTFDTVVRNHWRGDITMRFQPYRLAISKCFDGTDERISCVACHDPHQPLIREEAGYDSKCFACHAGPGHPAAVAAKASACRVATSNCASCHMPRLELPGAHQSFSDHYIRVVKAGEAYPY